jgi:hypothetical protein
VSVKVVVGVWVSVGEKKGVEVSLAVEVEERWRSKWAWATSRGDRSRWESGEGIGR